MKKVLIIYHSQTGNTQKLAQALSSGAKKAGAEVSLKKATEVKVEDILGCDVIAIGSPNYFSYMAGAVKDFFDRMYLVKDKITPKSYVIFVTHGGGGPIPVVQAIEHLCQSLNLKKLAEPLSCQGTPSEEDLKKAQSLGEKLIS